MFRIFNCCTNVDAVVYEQPNRAAPTASQGTANYQGAPRAQTRSRAYQMSPRSLHTRQLEDRFEQLSNALREKLTDLSYNISRAKIFLAVVNNDLAVFAEYLQSDDFDCNQAGELYMLLSVAADKGSFDIVRLLLRKKGIDWNKEGIDWNKSNTDGFTPLHIDAQNGHVNVVSALLKSVIVDFSKSTTNGSTPLHIAAQCGHVNIVSALLQNTHADCNKSRMDGATPLHMAAQNGHVNVVSALLAACRTRTGKALPRPESA